MIETGRLNATVTGLHGEMRRSIGHAYQAAMQAANSATSRQALAIADVFSRDVARAERLEFFQTLGERAHRTLLRSYDGHRRGPTGYRQNNTSEKYRRYAGGKLRAALAVPANVYEASATGIAWGPDVGELNKRARQWARMNFGALPKAGRGAQKFEVTISNVFLFAVGFDAVPSEPFDLPPGFWIEDGEPVGAGPRKTSAFYPRKLAYRTFGIQSGRGRNKHPLLTRRRRAGGIRAEHWFDRGLERLVHDIGDRDRGLPGLYRTFYRRGLGNVQPTRPPTVRVRTSTGRIIR